MKNTLLKLEDYFFPVVQVVASSQAPEEELEAKFEIDVSLHENKEEGLYQVAVDIHSSCEEQQAQGQSYDIHLVVIGIFSITSDFPNIPKLLYVDGSSMLYSAAREFLITVTSRGPWEIVKLPVFSFLEKYEEEREKTNVGEKGNSK